MLSFYRRTDVMALVHQRKFGQTSERTLFIFVGIGFALVCMAAASLDPISTRQGYIPFISLIVYHVTKPRGSRVDTLVDQLSTIFSGHVDFINHGHGTLLTWPVWCIVDLKHYISALSAKLRCSSSSSSSSSSMCLASLTHTQKQSTFTSQKLLLLSPTDYCGATRAYV